MAVHLNAVSHLLSEVLNRSHKPKEENDEPLMRDIKDKLGSEAGSGPVLQIFLEHMQSC